MDKLVRVWLKSGNDIWVVIHIDVQSQTEDDFAKMSIITACSTAMTDMRRVLLFWEMTTRSDNLRASGRN